VSSDAAEGAIAAVEVTLVPADLSAVTAAITKPAGSPSLGWAWIQLRGVVAIGLVVVAVLEPFAWCLVAAEAAAIAVELAWRRSPRQQQRLPKLLNGRYEVRDEGLRRVNQGGESLVYWPAIEQVTATSDHLMVRFGGTAWIVPFRCFASVEARDRFTRSLDERASVARSATGAT
jgi:hypothetical protein